MHVRFCLLWIGLLLSWMAPIPVLAEEGGLSKLTSPAVVEEIVVTSRRRPEDGQDVPFSVSVFDEVSLAARGLNNIQDLDAQVPNLYISGTPGGVGAGALFIRGIGYSDIEKTQQPQVGLIVDGLQLGSSTGSLMDTFDVERIEVNRGPQGVFFGKNTTGGNIILHRYQADASAFGAVGRVTTGNYDARTTQGRLNLPLIEEQLAFKLGVTNRTRDGYTNNPTLGQASGDVDYTAMTASLRWTPNATMDVTLTYDRLKDRSQLPPQDPRFDGDDPYQSLSDRPEPTRYDVDQFGLVVNADFERFSVHLISGWHDSLDRAMLDFDGATVADANLPFAQFHGLRQQDFEVLSNELRLEFALTARLRAMAGLFDYRSELAFNQRLNSIAQAPTAAFGPLFGLPAASWALFAGQNCAGADTLFSALAGLPLGLRANPNPFVGDALCQFPNTRTNQRASEKVISNAAFAALTWQPADAWEFTVGARTLREKKRFTNAFFDFSDGTFDPSSWVASPEAFAFSAFPERTGQSYRLADSWRDTIISASVQWSVSDNSQLYLSFNEGFRSGGYSIQSGGNPDDAEFDPESAWQLEFGSKNVFPEQGFTLNTAIFHTRVAGTQFTNVIALPAGSIPASTTIINNGGTVVNQGFEVDAGKALTEHWTLKVQGGFLHVDNRPFHLNCEVVDGCATGDPLVFDTPGTQRRFGGDADSRQPKWNYGVALAYERGYQALGLSALLAYQRVGDYLLVDTGEGSSQQLEQPGYGFLNASLAMAWDLAERGQLTVMLYGKNLTDQAWRQQALLLGSENSGFQSWAPPRTYGLDLRYSF